MYNFSFLCKCSQAFVQARRSMRLEQSSINPEIILRFEPKAYIQIDLSVICDNFYKKKSCRCGCQKYTNRQTNRIAFKKNGLKFTNSHFYANVHKHLFKPGDPFYFQKPRGISTFYGAHRKS